MSEQHYVKSFAKAWWKYWLGALLFGLIIGYLVSARLMPSYQGVVLFTVADKPTLAQKDTPFYLYDGYYNAQSSVTERNNLANWLQSSKTVFDIYTFAGLTPPTTSSDGLSHLFEVSDITGTTGANTVNLVVPASTKSEADSLGRAAVDYTKNHYLSTVTTINASDPLVLTVAPAKNIVFLGVTVGVAFAVFLLTLIIHYFKSEE